jgi:HlyD family secretion protein
MKSLTLFTTMPAILILSIQFLIGCTSSDHPVTGSGVIEATDVMVSAETTGKILKMNVNEGDAVTAGDIIAVIDTDILELERAATAATLDEIAAVEKEAQARLKQARTAVEGAKKNFDRATALRSKGSISQQAYDDLDTAYAMSLRQLDTAQAALEVFPARRGTVQARLQILDHQVDKGALRAPISGTVIETYANPGEQIAAMRPILKIADLSTVTVKIYISEPDLGRVKLAGLARIQPGSHTSTWFDGSVTWVADEAEFTPKNVQTRDARADLVYAVKISLGNEQGIFKIGMPVDVRLEGFPEFDQPDETGQGNRSWNPFS